MKAQLIAAGIAVLALGAVAPVARADGPRASSGNNWPGMSQSWTSPQVAAAPTARLDGPRASSGENWPGMSEASVKPVAAAPQTAPQYVWVEGYDHGGKWHGHWVLTH
jgi:hypothetical protein